MTSDTGTLFIVGVGRSGTSLLQSMLASNQNVEYLPETGYVRRFIFEQKLESCVENVGNDVEVDLLLNDDRLSRLGLDIEAMLRTSADMPGSIDVRLYEKIIESRGATAWVGDKDPKAVEMLPLIDALLPNVHVIFIYRDPRDVLASKMVASWSKGRNFLIHVFANAVQFRMGVEWGVETFGSRFHMLSYESLIDSPEDTLQQLCFDIGLPYSDKMLSFGAAAKSLVADDEKEWKKETFGPIKRDNQGKWPKLLSPIQIAVCEACCDSTIRFGNYSRSSSGSITKSQRLLADVFFAMPFRALEFIYMAYRRYTVLKLCKKLKKME